MRAKYLAWATLLSFWAMSRAGHAESLEEPVERARKLFAAASELQAEARWAEAALLYREAAALKDTPGLRFRAGYCEEQRQRLLEAMAEYERAAALLAQHPEADDVRRLLPRATVRVAARIPTLKVSLRSSVPGVTYSVDSKLLPRTQIGKPLPLNPGVHSVVIRASSGAAFSRRVTLAEGEHTSVVVPLPDAPKRVRTASEVDRKPATERGASWRSVALTAGAGATLVSLGAGLTYLLLERQARGRYQNRANQMDSDACRDPAPDQQPGCHELRQALAGQHRARQRAALALGAAAAGATLTLTGYWLGSGTRVTTSGTITPRGATFTLGGSL